MQERRSRMKRTLALTLVLTSLAMGRRSELGAAMAQPPQTPQTTATSPELERRDLPVTDDDLRILLKARELLKNDSVWNRKDDRECLDDEATGKRSLFCALQKACIEVLGVYQSPQSCVAGGTIRGRGRHPRSKF